MSGKVKVGTVSRDIYSEAVTKWPSLESAHVDLGFLPASTMIVLSRGLLLQAYYDK